MRRRRSSDMAEDGVKCSVFINQTRSFLPAIRYFRYINAKREGYFSGRIRTFC